MEREQPPIVSGHGVSLVSVTMTTANSGQALTISDGEAVEKGQAIEPVVVLAVSHGVHPGPVSEQGPLQPCWNAACWKRNC